MPRVQAVWTDHPRTLEIWVFNFFLANSGARHVRNTLNISLVLRHESVFVDNPCRCCHRLLSLLSSFVVVIRRPCALPLFVVVLHHSPSSSSSFVVVIRRRHSSSSFVILVHCLQFMQSFARVFRSMWSSFIVVTHSLCSFVIRCRHAPSPFDVVIRHVPHSLLTLVMSFVEVNCYRDFSLRFVVIPGIAETLDNTTLRWHKTKYASRQARNLAPWPATLKPANQFGKNVFVLRGTLRNGTALI